VNSPFPPDWVLEHAERNPQAPAVDSYEARLSYADLAQRMRLLSAQLAAAGVRQGEPVPIVLPNLPAAVVAALAVQALGACPVEMNRGWGADAFRALLAQIRPRHAFVLGRDARVWGEVARSQPPHFWVVHPGDLTPALRGALGGATATWLREDGSLDPAQAAPQISSAPAGRHPDSPGLILYTSGSTGRPRAVVQTFRNLDANARSIVQYLGLTSADRAMLVLPLSYCYGRSVLHTHLLAGGSVFLDDRFMYPRLVLETLASEGCTGFAGVPSTFELIRRQVDLSSLTWPRLRYVTQAGGAMAVETIRWVRRSFHPAPLFVMYGQTEATSRLSYLPPERAADKEGSIGIAIPDVELKVVDDEGVELAPGETGHLVARGDSVTLGYLDEPEETAAILRDGWLWTGDLAYRDADGFFFHAGRSREVLKIGGHRVSPAEIEHALERHPEVVEAAVVAVRNQLAGDAAAALVVRQPAGSVSEGELRRFCRELLPAYKVPATIRFVDKLPRNASGKLLRAQLAGLGGPAPVQEDGS
jgi:acyl-CoA synthetase (AMP-forming)/AMP-acid ligase II